MRTARLLVVLAARVAGCGSTANSAPDVGCDVARAELTTAGLNLTTWYQAHGTYAGVTTGLPSVTIVHAGTTSLCVQDATAHLAGPGGTVTTGPCS